ncbi:sulfurtransferase TusA family protein, partial [Oleiphilus sp. HI0043]
MQFDYLVDASGEACPMPLLKAKQQLNKMSAGECVKVIATDK